MTQKILKSSVTIASVSLCLAIFSSYPAFQMSKLGVFEFGGLTFHFVLAFSSLVFMLSIPLFFGKHILGKNTGEFGFCIPQNSGVAMKLAIICLLIFMPIVFILSKEHSVQNFYLIKNGFGIFFILATISRGIYYIGEEFLFRGFMFFGLWDKIKIHSLWVTSLVFALLHMGKPVEEIFFSFFLSLSLCFISLKTKSFLPSFVIHFVLAITLNVLVTT